LAGTVLFLLNVAYGRIKRIQRQDLGKFLLLAFFEPFIYFVCETYGVEMTSPTISAMIIATIPIFSIAAGRIFFKERITALNIVGVTLSLMGIIMVIMKGDIGGNDLIMGIILLIVAVIAEVGHATITKSLSGNYSSQIIVMYQFLIGSVYLLPLFLRKGLDGFNATLYFSADVWYPLICLAILCSSLAFSLWVSTIKHLGVAKSSIFSALIPVVTALIAWILGTQMTTMQWAGIAISTVGVILSQYTSKK
jgi:drug/metabolite transporter (DMT)-like permease